MTKTTRASITALCALAGVLLVSGPGAGAQEQPGAGGAAAPAAPQKRQVSRSAIKRLFQIIRAEPKIKDVQQAAVRHYRLEPDRINRLARNARLKGLVPNLSANFTNDLGTRYTNTKDGLFPVLPSPDNNPNPNNFKERVSENTDQLGWSVSASWELDRLVFASEALDAKSLTSLEENLVREVTTLYFSRRRVLASIILSPPDDDEEFFYELMRLDEMTATLDSFTGGMFGKKAWNWEKELVPQ